ncbi:OLC1v1012321C1 [Oldenlandia corymbosa var. corymbosa]|uniref:OLC1v1012321C1 n=1 Tax=Oldenlandia corymbosa var. corymbosa TaxID=529605 RepID=A0AAV1DVW1_OLDCO|nr:OLC1v1012321C1 [Oldenlandia corymbosa var. corymbosa]
MERKKPKSKTVWRRPPPKWTELPREITANILQRLDVEDILEVAQRVCRTWRSVCKDPSMWRKIDMSLYDDDDESVMMCEHAVDLSQGQLMDIRLGFFTSDSLLLYIAERSSQLRYLSLDSCWDDVSGHGLTEAIKRFPLLEELHLFNAEVPSEAVEVVGRCCPLLKSFSLAALANVPGDPVTKCNKDALAIAKTMTGLQHLCLVGNKLTNDGLLAILDGCTHLESLDLRGCLRVDLEGDIGKRCSQQLKCVRQPNDSIEDLEMYNPGAFDDYGSYTGSDSFEDSGSFSGSDVMSDSDDEY